MDVLSEPHFTNENAARDFIEALRWPDGRVCPHCGVVEHSYATGKCGVYRCAEPACRMDFTVTTKSVMESSHIPLHKWLQGFYLMSSSKKGISAHQLHRTVKITYKSAWFMCHRIREAMRNGGLASPMGGPGMIVEADETYYGKPEVPHVSPQRGKRPYNRKPKVNTRPIVALVERGGNVRTFHVPVADKASVHKIVTDNIARESRLHTDESKLYGGADM